MILQKETSARLLYSLLDQFRLLGFVPVIGVEIEFYLTSICDNLQDHFKDIDGEIIKEEGFNQFEIVINHSKNIFTVIEEIKQIKEILKYKANFSAKPFLNEPGSALHIHINLEDLQHNNVFIKREEQESDIFLYSIGGLCSTMEESTLLFAPYENAYLRYKALSYESPSKICWGYNNRSAALRIPVDSPQNRRIEHRVSCADSCPEEVICGIFFGILKGIKEKILPPEQVYGNAYLDQYDLPYIPQTLEEAKDKFFKGSIFKMIA